MPNEESSTFSELGSEDAFAGEEPSSTILSNIESKLSRSTFVDSFFAGAGASFSNDERSISSVEGDDECTGAVSTGVSSTELSSSSFIESSNERSMSIGFSSATSSCFCTEVVEGVSIKSSREISPSGFEEIDESVVFSAACDSAGGSSEKPPVMKSSREISSSPEDATGSAVSVGVVESVETLPVICESSSGVSEVSSVSNVFGKVSSDAVEESASIKEKSGSKESTSLEEASGVVEPVSVE